MIEFIKNTVHSLNAAVFTGIAGIALIVTGEVAAGSFVLVGSLAAFIFFEWWYVDRLETIDADHQRAADVASRAIDGWKEQLDQREEAVAARERAVVERERELELL